MTFSLSGLRGVRNAYRTVSCRGARCGNRVHALPCLIALCSSAVIGVSLPKILSRRSTAFQSDKLPPGWALS